MREGGGGDGEGVSADRCIAGLVGEMNEERKAIVRKVRKSNGQEPQVRVPSNCKAAPDPVCVFMQACETMHYIPSLCITYI